jgi:hypothetical protein
MKNLPFAVIIAIFVFGALAIYGWIANVVKIIFSLGDPTVTPLWLARIVGVFFAPLGAALGFF